jgi:hypothetical protein
MKTSLNSLAAALLFVACGSSNQKTVNKAPADPTIYGNTITSSELKEMLYTYSSDEF